MEILYLSHCVPNPPNKGEKIRAYHELTYLASRYRVHLACFAKSRKELEEARQLEDRCASVLAVPLTGFTALVKAAFRFAAGSSVTVSYYGSRRLTQHVGSLVRQKQIAAVVAYSSAMVSHVPEGIPMVLDMVDVDSEKWRQYAKSRFPRHLYDTEARRLRLVEGLCAERAACTIFTTSAEETLFQKLFPGAVTRFMENGVDCSYFDPSRCGPQPNGRSSIAFVGAMDYFPNADAVVWFANSVYPALKKRNPAIEFLIVGRNPAPRVSALAKIPGITVTGEVADIRPYLASVRAAVIPLRIARGIQNKVLEALAFGKPVIASEAVCRTFGDPRPNGLIRCDSVEEYIEAVLSVIAQDHSGEPAIRDENCRRFCWDRNLPILLEELEKARVDS
jgi:polysaccharide biosynthesis protein PslH